MNTGDCIAIATVITAALAAVDMVVNPHNVDNTVVVSQTREVKDEPVTVTGVFAAACSSAGNANALRSGPQCDVVTTWAEWEAQVSVVGRSLMALGVEPGMGVGMLGFNCPEWVTAYLGAISAGAVAVGIYATNSAETCSYVLQHSQTTVVFVEDLAQLGKVRRVPGLEHAVVWGQEGTDLASEERDVCKLWHWSAFLALADTVPPSALSKRTEALRPTDCCSLIYTSGTTGRPKGVMLSHDNITWTSRSVLKLMPDFANGHERIVSYLPLSHVAAQLIDVHGLMAAVANGGKPGTLYFAQPDALKGSLKQTLLQVRPTVFFGVPRVWEKLQEALQRVRETQQHGCVRDVTSWAQDRCVDHHHAQQQKRTSPTQPSAASTVAQTIMWLAKRQMGLDACRYFYSGAAPISHDTLRFFGGLDMPIFELYGMSESSGPQTVGTASRYAWGTVGRALPGTEIKIEHVEDRNGRQDPAGEGEVCIRGRHVMMGYLKDAEATSQAVDGDGWLHSGDLGTVTPDGLLRITGRIKELIIGAGGENVAPVPIEDRIKALCKDVSQVMVVGDRRKYLVALVTASSRDLSEAEVQTAIDAYNRDAPSNAQRIQKFHICAQEFTEERGEVTPTQKLRRRAILRNYTPEIDRMYGDGE